jgi:Domain of unknown function (DUF4252)
MKKLAVFMILLFMMTLSIDLVAGSNPVDEFIDLHKNTKGAFHLDLSTSFLSEENEDLFSKVDNVRIFSLDQEGPGLFKSEIKSFKKDLRKEGYDTYMTIKDSGSLVDFFALEKKGKVNNWVMLIDGKDSFFILEISGDFELKDIQKIGEKLDLKESKYMKEK